MSNILSMDVTLFYIQSLHLLQICSSAEKNLHANRSFPQSYRYLANFAALYKNAFNGTFAYVYFLCKSFILHLFVLPSPTFEEKQSHCFDIQGIYTTVWRTMCSVKMVNFLTPGHIWARLLDYNLLVYKSFRNKY